MAVALPSPSTPPPINLKDYVTTEKLGAGTYGSVFKAHRKTGSRDVVAVKCVRKADLSKKEVDCLLMEIKLLKHLKHDYIVEMLDFQWDSNYIYIITEYCGGGDLSRFIKARKCLPETLCRQFLQQLARLLMEIKLLKHLKHDYIVEMLDFQWDSNYIYIITEYCGGGDLSRFIKARKCLPETLCRQFLQQLALSLKFLRSRDIAHMDLKPANILLTSLRNPRLKLADFGLAQYLGPNQVQTRIRGTPLYMAPEMLLDQKYDAKVDIWSVGVILFESIFGKAPYKSDSVDLLLEKIKEERPIEIPTNRTISADCRDLLERCLKRNPLERIGFDEFFDHPFLDFEHLPTPESMEKAIALMGRAVAQDKDGQLEEALNYYKQGLEYFVPWTTHETNPSKKEALRTRTKQYIKRAEQIKEILNPDSVSTSSSSSVPRPGSSQFNTLQRASSLNVAHGDELLRLCEVTPALKTAVEIARSAEGYELEGRYPLALEKYQLAMEMILPLLPAEPKGERKTILKREVTQWMKSAECIKDIIAILRKVLAENGLSLEDKDSLSLSHKHCIVM
ncbi:LOW QUALITY PROTEIN: serine/threonine-protein kinase ULK3-like [Tigriopus californicus]|uniref:LOW QUALITY PROTEIN: serine/threonine-protein kinase ULK3-like n=1 Tax=Tigriopus californicus TaxID=6832 RepID=UPI0027DA27EB|nr:LOW QUALITY PROTEIN: serine/threonine-protein kinase ULK3-like [Tigriopus californicus]